MSQSNALPNDDVSPRPADSPAIGRRTSLLVSQTTLRFDRIAPGRDSFRILRITPSLPGTPVTVTTNQPDDFQVAVGVEQLVFGPALTFTPEPEGTYIHLRYKPRQAGRHRATLQVSTAHEQQTVALKGRTTGLAGRLVDRRPRTGYVPATAAAPDTDQPFAPLDEAPTPPTGTWLKPLLLAGAAAGLLWLGYANRCTLMPSLCQAAVVAPASPVAVDTVRSAAAPTAPVAAPARRRTKRVASTDAATEQPTAASRSELNRRRRADRASTAVRPRESSTEAPKRSTGQESDLERVLNRPNQ